MTAGVRQGCPLSPLLYAVCAELLIERIRMELPSAVIRAYADDTAVLVQNLWEDTPTLARIFTDFGNISNLQLNLNKTVVIPLFPNPDLSTVQNRLSQSVPSWSAVQFSYYAKYLGFILGPEAGDKGWKDPVTKFLQRAQAWSDRQLGLYCTTTSYNVFASSVLTYLAQLLPPPKAGLGCRKRSNAQDRTRRKRVDFPHRPYLVTQINWAPTFLDILGAHSPSCTNQS